LLEAIHKKSSKGYHSWDAWKEFKNPNEEEWECCPTHKFPVSFVKPHTRKNEVFVTSHFRSKNQHCPTGESDKHRKTKTLIASLVENKNIEICYDDFVIPFKNLVYKDIPKIPFRWEEIKVGNRRGDIVFDLVGFNSLLGKGIVFEIQLSKISEREIKKREHDWCENGYSFAWITPDMITENENSLTTNKIPLTYLFSIKLNTHIFNHAEKMKRLAENMQDSYRRRMLEIDEILHNLKRDNNIWMRNTCRTCEFGGINKHPESHDDVYSGLMCCWFSWKMGVQKFPDKVEPMSSCHNFKSKLGGEQNESRVGAIHKSE
jgi:hypothetical protein